jgi:hypothetical protein
MVMSIKFKSILKALWFVKLWSYIYRLLRKLKDLLYSLNKPTLSQKAQNTNLKTKLSPCHLSIPQTPRLYDYGKS